MIVKAIAPLLVSAGLAKIAPAQGPRGPRMTLAQATAAAQKGSVAGQSRLGELYERGEGVAKSDALARSWYEKAARQGEGRSLLSLGLMYRAGRGGAKDPQRAFEYFVAAKVAGDMKAGRYVGLHYAEVGDDKLAASYYAGAAAKGDITSQDLLGRAYEAGKGVPQSYALAARWYAKSAERGDHVAADGMVDLAGLYERGQGVPQSPEKARALYRKAAATGNERAKAALKRWG